MEDIDEDRDVGRVPSERGIVLLDMLRMVLVRALLDSIQNMPHQTIVQSRSFTGVAAPRRWIGIYACKAEENTAFYS